MASWEAQLKATTEQAVRSNPNQKQVCTHQSIPSHHLAQLTYPPRLGLRVAGGPKAERNVHDLSHPIKQCTPSHQSSGEKARNVIENRRTTTGLKVFSCP